MGRATQNTAPSSCRLSSSCTRRPSAASRLSCSREWSQMITPTAPRKPMRKAETVPAALGLDSRHPARWTSRHRLVTARHGPVVERSRCGHCHALRCVQKLFIKIQILKVRHNSARRQSEQGRGRDGRGRARGPARFNLHGSSVCPRPPSPPAHQCAAGAGARRVADAMRASSRPAWGTRHE